MDCFVATLLRNDADDGGIRHHAGTFGSGTTFGSGLFTR